MKNTTKHVVIVESFSSGGGFDIIESALKRGFKVSYLSMNRKNLDAFTSKYGTYDSIQSFEVDTLHFHALLRLVNKIHSTHTINAIISMVDDCILNVAKVANLLGLKFTNVNALNLARNKYKMRNYCKALGILVPKSKTARSYEEFQSAISEIGFPLILKPSFGSSSCFVNICKNKEEAERYWEQHSGKVNSDRFGLLIVDEYVTGPLFSVEAITQNNQTTILGITDRVIGGHPFFVEKGASFPIELPEEVTSPLFNDVKNILSQINYGLGFSHTEFILSENGPVFIELNPRIGGICIGRLMSYVYQQDFYDLYLDLFIGNEISKLKKEQLAASILLIYSSQGGVFKSLEGLHLAKSFPGVLDIIHDIRSGTPVRSSHDFNSILAFVITGGKNTTQAKMNSNAVASALIPIIE